MPGYHTASQPLPGFPWQGRQLRSLFPESQVSAHPWVALEQPSAVCGVSSSMQTPASSAAQDCHLACRMRVIILLSHWSRSAKNRVSMSSKIHYQTHVLEQQINI